MIQTEIRNDPVKPGVETAIEAERVEVAVNAEKGFLINVRRIVRRAQKIQCEPENTLIVGLDQLGKGVLIALLGGAGRKSAIPFGPFLAAGAVIAVFVGHQIADAYLNLLT